MERIDVNGSRTSGGSTTTTTTTTETTTTTAGGGGVVEEGGRVSGIPASEIESETSSQSVKNEENVGRSVVAVQQPKEEIHTDNNNSSRATSTSATRIPANCPATDTVVTKSRSCTGNDIDLNPAAGVEATGVCTTKVLTIPSSSGINKERTVEESRSRQGAVESDTREKIDGTSRRTSGDCGESCAGVVVLEGDGVGECVGEENKCATENNNEESVPKPVPNFRVEGTGAGDSSITVALASLTSAVAVNSCLMDNLVKNARLDNNSVSEGEGQPGSGSGPVSVQSSEEMRLSLVSWYSEPDNNNESTSCCSKTTASNLMSSSAEEIEKENKTPLSCLSECASFNSVSSSKGHKDAFSDNYSNSVNSKDREETQNNKISSGKPSTSGQRIKMHVQLFEQKSAAAAAADKCTTVTTKDGKKIECPRCSRRSKSGTNTPAAPTRQPRRVVQSSKSTQELKKPIKSILKSDSRGSGSGSGSGSEKQSSMDSLGSGSGSCGGGGGPSLPATMTRSDSGARAKFNFTNSDTCTTYPEDRIVSRLKRIEKYATLRIKKSRSKTADCEKRGDSSTEGCFRNGHCSSNKTHDTGGTTTDLMSKSMSVLEKSSATPTQSNSLKRQGSLRLKKAPPQWDPCVTRGTRTSVLRFQKMQEAKAKTGGTPGGGAPSGSSSGGSTGNSGSAHSGSGDSIHFLSHSHSHHHHNANVIGGVSSSGPQSAAFINNPNATSNFRPHAAAKEKHLGAKVFSKLSSATGQTTSSNMKRLKQERGIQTEPVILPHSSTTSVDSGIRTSPCPMSSSADYADQVEQIKSLKSLSQRYMNTAIKYQEDFNNSEAERLQLIKQLEESKTENKEVIEFLQTEKSMLDESLAESKSEAKKWREKVETVEKDSQTLCSSLVRLSEQHKQESLKAQALLQRLETQSQNTISQLAAQNADGAAAVHQMKTQVLNLIESLLKTYKVSSELLTNAGASAALGVGLDESDLSCSLLLPLITLLSNAFQIPPPQTSPTVTSSQNPIKSPPATTTKFTTGQTTTTTTTTTSAANTTPTSSPSNLITVAANVTLPKVTSGGNSLQTLNQAILDREEAERLGQEEISNIKASAALLEDDAMSPDGDYFSLKREVAELNSAVEKLLCVIKVIVIHCDQKVSYVASNIVQCLNSMEDERVGTIPQHIAQVQKSLEAWSEGSGSGNGGSDGSTQCKSSISSATGTSSASKLCVGNGHAQF